MHVRAGAGGQWFSGQGTEHTRGWSHCGQDGADEIEIGDFDDESQARSRGSDADGGQKGKSFGGGQTYKMRRWKELELGMSLSKAQLLSVHVDCSNILPHCNEAFKEKKKALSSTNLEKLFGLFGGR